MQCFSVVPPFLTIIELVVEKHISNRRVFSEAIVALIGGYIAGESTAH